MACSQSVHIVFLTRGEGSIGQGGLVIPPGQYVRNVRLGMDATNDICNLKALALQPDITDDIPRGKQAHQS